MELNVADYMSPRPFSIETSDSLENAIDVMAAQRIGNLVIKEKRNVKGILTEREILQHLATKKKIEGTKISKIRLSPFIVVNPQTSLVEAAKLMISQKNRLLVYEDRKLIGIITATDMVRAFRRTSSNPSLEKVTKNHLITVKGSDDISKAVQLMHYKRIGCVIVTKRNVPYGIFTERDLLVNVLSYDADLKNPVIGYCTNPLVTTEVGIRGGDAARIMAENDIKRLILTKHGKVVSIVTVRDIVDAFQYSFNG